MKREEHLLLSQTGRGTPMGELLRRYWTPALLSREVEADGAPVRVRLLGEDLIAFRDSAGRVGLLDEHCSHRGASLHFAKNAECGLRCWYHGWKYDTEGNCLDMPNEPPQTQFKDKVRQRAYPCIERNGLVLAYLGPPEKKPALPDLEWLLVPQAHVYISKRLQECHWLQGMDGDVDSVHVGFLHGGDTIKRATEHKMFDSGNWMSSDNNPKIELKQIPAGILYGSRRNSGPDQYYWRIGEWFLPNFTIIASFPGDSPLGGHAWVPVDDDKAWAFGISWHPKRALSEEELRYFREGTPTGMHSSMIPGTAIAKRNKSNGYVDPEAASAKQPWQRITYFQDQDTAITESIGAHFDRTRENLGTTDAVIVHMRRRLMAAALDLQNGKEPPTDPKPYAIRGLSTLLPKDTPSWSDAVADRIAARPETFQPGV